MEVQQDILNKEVPVEAIKAAAEGSDAPQPHRKQGATRLPEPYQSVTNGDAFDSNVVARSQRE